MQSNYSASLERNDKSNEFLLLQGEGQDEGIKIRYFSLFQIPLTQPSPLCLWVRWRGLLALYAE
jgi:hypothetical protein